MNKTDDILERLKNMPQPIIDNPDDLTERIMGSLGSQDSKVTTPTLTGKARSGALPLIRTILSLAALWIIGFFIYLQFDSVAPVSQQTQPPQPSIINLQSSPTLREVYKNHLCQDCKKSISYTQLRSMLYENK